MNEGKPGSSTVTSIGLVVLVVLLLLSCVGGTLGMGLWFIYETEGLAPMSSPPAAGDNALVPSGGEVEVIDTAPSQKQKDAPAPVDDSGD